MPEDFKVSQIGSSPLPPPFRGLHSLGVRKQCQIIFACYFRKSSIATCRCSARRNQMASSDSVAALNKTLAGRLINIISLSLSFTHRILLLFLEAHRARLFLSVTVNLPADNEVIRLSESQSSNISRLSGCLVLIVVPRDCLKCKLQC